MLHKNDSVDCTNGETRGRGVKSYLCGSVPVQKSLVKLAGLSRGGRSQRIAAMRCGEGADQRYSGGWRFGLTDARVSALAAKRTGWFLPVGLGGSIRLIRRAFRVMRVATWRKRSSLSTIELPHRPRVLPVVTGRYKAVPKDLPHAMVSVTSFLRRAVWGTQLDQSNHSGPRTRVTKGRSAGSRVRLLRTGVVSLPAQAAFGPGCASSHLNPQQAKQHSPFPESSLACRSVGRQVQPIWS
jgi:hypothetical protein